jgi:K+-transporting ATPase A subunit
MTPHGWLLTAVFVLLVEVTVRPLGGYMAWVFTGQFPALALGPLAEHYSSSQLY